MDYTIYARIIDSVKSRAPIESGIQALIYMLVLEKLKDKKHDVVIIDKMQNHSIFMSYGGISDLAIVDNEFDYNTSDRTKIKMCIEVKLDKIKHKDLLQMKKQLLTYKKAVITNGKEWFFYDLDNSFGNLDMRINSVIGLERKLAEEKGVLKKLCQKRTSLVKNSADTGPTDIDIECIKEVISKLENTISNTRKGIDSEVDYKSIRPKKEDCFIIDSDDSLKKLCEKIDEFIV